MGSPSWSTTSTIGASPPFLAAYPSSTWPMKLASGSPGWPIIMITRGSLRRVGVRAPPAGGRAARGGRGSPSSCSGRPGSGCRWCRRRACRPGASRSGRGVRRGPGLGAASGSSRSMVPAVEMPRIDPSVGSRPYAALMPRSAVSANNGMASRAMSFAPPARVPEVPDGEGEPGERRGHPPPGGLAHRTAEQVEHVDRPPQDAGARRSRRRRARRSR